MGVFTGLLDAVRLPPTALRDHGIVAAARAACEARHGPAGPVPPVPGSGPDASAPFPGPGAGKSAALQLVCAHHPSLRSDLETLTRLWRVVADAPSAHSANLPPDQARELAALLDWASWELEYAQRPPPLVIGVALAELLTLAPFPQGNVRLAKVWGSLLLLKAGYSYVPLVSVEEGLTPLAARMRACRERLARDRDRAALEIWLEAFLELLAAQALRAEGMLARGAEGPPLPELQARLVEIARAEGRITSRRAQELTGVSRNTLKDNFRRLVERGLLARHGQRRGCFYTLAKQGGDGA